MHLPFQFLLRGNNNLDLLSLAIYSQAIIAPDFEGNWFDRQFCKGSGLLPQTGSPQDQGLFVFTGMSRESVSGLLARSPCRFVLAEPAFPLLAMYISTRAGGFPTFPLALVLYFQNMNQGGLCSACAGAGASAVCMSRVCRRSICWSFMASWAVSVSIRLLVPCASPGASARAAAPPISTLHRPSCLCAPSVFCLIRLRTVSAETPRCVAASLIETSMGFTVGHGLVQSAYSAYADCRQFGGGSGGGAVALVGRAVVRW